MPSNRISTPDVIPQIESRLFDEHETAHLAVGIVALGNEVMPGLENEYAGYTLLRGNVYAKQKNYMPLDELNADGTETDPDDARSIHFAVIENAMDSQRVVGAMRLIIKSREGEAPLPIEDHYPEAFSSGPALALSTEVSRLICRHENKKVQRNLKWPLFTAGVSYVIENGLGPVFGAVEESLEQGLQTAGVPVSQLGTAKYVEEFNASKLPIRIDIAGLARKIEDDQPNLLSAMHVLKNDFVYSGVVLPVSNKAMTVA